MAPRTMSRAKDKLFERDLAEPVRAYLKAGGWELYEEVPAAGKIPDIIATGPHGVAVFELKTALGFPVITQARHWLSHAHYSWIAVPGGKATAERDEALEVCAWRGIGVLEVRPLSKLEQERLARGQEPDEPRVIVVHEAVRQRPADNGDALRDALRPEHQDGSFAGAGTKTGERATKTNITLQEIRVYLAEQGGRAPLESVIRAFRVPWIIPKLSAGEIPRLRLDGRAVIVMLELVEAGNEAPLLSDRSSRTAPRERRAFG